MNPSLKKKYGMILAKENAMARSIAAKMIQPKPIGVWEFLLPIVFILGFAKLKQSRELFVRNFLFTKTMALEGARDMIQNNLDKKEVLAGIESRTVDILASHTSDVYSEDIRQKQVMEMDLLLDHYNRLLRATGNDYRELVLSAYADKAGYQGFLGQLKAVEDDVLAAAKQTLGDRTDEGSIQRLKQAKSGIREAEVKSIFQNR